MQRYRKIEKAVGGGAELCGNGAYGVVYKALDLHTQKVVALKRIKAGTDVNGLRAIALREFTLLKSLQTIGHPNIVTVENVLLESHRIFLAFELMEGDLYHQMMSLPAPHALCPSLTHSYTQQITSGLAFIHSRGIMHRDLKPQNLLVSRTDSESCGYVIKIADFGLARTFTPYPRPLSTKVVTLWYRPPEILMGASVYSCAVDLWSVACIVAEMSNGRPLFPSLCEIDQLHRIFRLLGTPTKDTWPQFTSMPFYRNTFPQWTLISTQRVMPNLSAEGVDFVENILMYEANKRMTAVEALSHPYLQSFPAHSSPCPCPSKGQEELEEGRTTNQAQVERNGIHRSCEESAQDYFSSPSASMPRTGSFNDSVGAEGDPSMEKSEGAGEVGHGMGQGEPTNKRKREEGEGEE